MPQIDESGDDGMTRRTGRTWPNAAGESRSRHSRYQRPM